MRNKKKHFGWFLVTEGDLRGTFQTGSFVPEYVSVIQATEIAEHLLTTEDYPTLISWFADWIKLINESDNRGDYVSLCNCTTMIKALFYIRRKKKMNTAYADAGS